ncbi:MAG: Ppx/GppA family phosphatase [Rhodospirillales bacterium]|nr:MAG: Ppx/GppA family phosphatase [Rhodospirillales bacterium]
MDSTAPSGPRRNGGPQGALSTRRTRRPNGRRPEACAALDLGTNNCRLLVAHPARNGFRIVDAFSRVVRLGEGVEEAGRLSEPAIERTIEALKVCAGKIRKRRVTRGRYVATAACRKAENCDAFLDRVASETGLRIEIISAEEEARLTLTGCLPLLDGAAPRALVFDIGGGSTEVLWLDAAGPATRLIDWISLPLGVVTLTERYGQGPFPPDAYRTIVDELLTLLQPFCERHEITRYVRDAAVQMLGSSGTVTTLAGLWQELPRYDRSRVDGAFLEFEAVHRLTARLSAMSAEDRARHPCIGRDRADMMAAGCAILEAICRRWPVGRLRVADRGIREGILVDLLGRGGNQALLGDDRG